jgi:hypothetical protein
MFVILFWILEMPLPNKRKKQLAAVQDDSGERRKESKRREERLKALKENSSPIEAIVVPDTISSSLYGKKRTPIATSRAEAAINTALPDGEMSLPSADVDVDVDNDAHANPRATDPPTSTSTSAQGIKLEPETSPAPAPVPANTCTDQAEASIPTETMMAINGSNLHPTVTVRRNATKRTFPWDDKAAGEIHLSSLPPQADAIPARKKPRVEEPLPTATDEAARKTASPEISTGLPTPDTPPSSATVDVSTRRQSRHQIQIPPMKSSETQLDDAADLSDPVLPPPATMNVSTRRRSPRRVIPTSTTGTPLPLPAAATVNALTHRRSSRRVIPTSSTTTPIPPAAATTRRRSSRRVVLPPNTATVDVSTSCRSRRQTQLSPNETSEAQLDDDDVDDLYLSCWKNHLTELVDYRNIHGHCNVPRNYVKTSKLGFWVKKQRSDYKLYRDGKTSPMTPFRVRKLESLGFEWDCYGATRGDRMNELVDYRNIHGHCNVPVHYSKNPKLGVWVSKQRSNYKLYRDGKKSHLTALRIQELESLGFEWDCLGAAWEDRMSELVDYRNLHGHCNVPVHDSENPKLGVWVSKQRMNYKLYRDGKTSHLTAMRIQKLEGLGFEWDCLGAAWEDRMSELVDYRKIHGHCNVPVHYSKNPKLGVWVSKRRMNYRLYRDGKKSHMTALRIQELESLGFEWDCLGAAWEDRMRELADYRNLHGHCNVPVHYSENPKLGVWVSKRRMNYRLYRDGKKSHLTALRIQELESLGFEWDCLGATWEDRMSELVDYLKIHGHCNVAVHYSKNPKLGVWVSKQRMNYRLYRDGKKSHLTALRIQKLESLGFEWDCLGATWEDRMSELVDYRNIHGHCNVPSRYSENAKLGNWVSKQRSNYKLYRDGKKSHLTALRIQELERLGFE